ncbi:Transcriptional repressor frmR [Bordetella ansorpii]|uniref:Transcriptional repressor frmR n=1 Tax=Bordetella ansorpii TaxID=288768 RepID=A0A157R2E6_9BORD|nr:metal/formaldehyde-sensitive transcriptional repressor [Bordetella ansorpii]SAI52130.1 Transcriptional repressor frmR [Bordetella ansorpii]
MSHTTRQKDKLIARVRRMRGQLEAVERALDTGESCIEVLRQLASVRGAVTGLTAEVMADHLQEHVVDEDSHSARHQAGDELVEVIRAYLK